MDVAVISPVFPAHLKTMPATNELLQEGRYRINQQFASDGEDAVYEAYDTVRDTNVVVKEIPFKLNKVTTLSQQETMKQQFATQAKVLTEIKHDSLMHVHDFFADFDRHYLVMEAVEGDDLKQLLDRNKSAFAISDVLEWADQLLDALNYLHTYKPPIIHQNIKPENIKLGPDGKIKLFAFGLTDGSDTKVSTSLAPDDQENIRYSPLELIWQSLDPASQKVITNSYDERSERILKEPADARSDIYSLGATLYHLVTAREPIDALERSIEILEGKPDPLKEPSKLDPRIPSEISDVLVKALEIKRENRYDSAVIMRQVLRAAVARVQEREEAEAREQEEAAEAIAMAHTTRLDEVRNIVEQKRLEMEAEKQRLAEEMEAKLREAEEQRLLAEQRAAEAERLLQEKLTRAADAERLEREEEAKRAADQAERRAKEEAAGKAAEAERLAKEEAAKHAAEEERLAEEEVKRAAAAKQQQLEEAERKAAAERERLEKEAARKAEEELRRKAEAAELEQLELEMAKAAAVESIDEDDDVIEIDVETESQPEPMRSVADDDDDAMPFASGYGEAKSRSALPMIGGGVALIAIIAVAVWMFVPMGNAGSAQNAPVQSAVQNEQVQTAPQQPAAPPAETTSMPAAVPSAEPSPETVEIAPVEASPVERTAAVPASQTKAKKPTAEPAPSKAPAEKKKSVTVDDLINDN